jgi:hypothetical protein
MHFSGEALERRPWAYQREDRPQGVQILSAAGWTGAHRFLFADLRQHLLGWPPSLDPDGHRRTLPAAPAPA